MRYMFETVLKQLVALALDFQSLPATTIFPIIALAVLFFCFTFTGKRKYRHKRKRKQKPWRTSASKTWLQQFRENKLEFTPDQRFSYIRGVDHFLWEEILMSCFEERGYAIKRTKMTRDGGSDGFVTINKLFVVIQAKRYSGPIAKADVSKLNKLVNDNPRFHRGLFIHSGTTSGPIKDLFKESPFMDLLSGTNRLLTFLDGEAISVLGISLKALK